MIKKETRYKISSEIGVSERTVAYEIQKIKKLYKDYCNVQLVKANLLK
jgi:transcriptional antiterminator